MDLRPAYPIDKTYGAFLHRELSVSWLVLATLLGGRHRIDPGLLSTGFAYLDFGCGHGLNLLFNAAAHPYRRGQRQGGSAGPQQRALRPGGSDHLCSGSAQHRPLPWMAGVF